MNVCRFCLSEGVGFSTIFGTKISHVQKLVKQLENNIGFQLLEVDNWPTQICPECIGEVANVVNFCDKIKQTQLTIEARYGKAPVLVPVIEEEEEEEEDETVIRDLQVLNSNDGNVYEIKFMEGTENVQVKSSERGDASDLASPPTVLINIEKEVNVEPPEKVQKKTHSGDDKTPDSTTTERSSRSSKRPRSPKKSIDNEEEEVEDSPSKSPAKTKTYTGKEINETLREFGVLSCKLCPEPENFVDFKTMKTHNDSQHNLTGVACCAKVFATRIRIFEHVQFHLRPGTIQCDQCQKNFKTRAGLKIHVENHHSDEKFACESCEFVCKSEKLLRRHELTHIPQEERPTACDQCDFKCNFMSQLVTHKKSRHSAVKEIFICNECGKGFSTKGNLTNHRKSIHDPDAEKPICLQCGKAVRRLSRHLTICQVQLKLKCPDCDNVHPNVHALRTHIKRMHRKDTSKLTCTICDKVLSRESHLREHMASHTNTALYRCQFCEKSFNSSSNMYKHLRVKHFEEWKERKDLQRSSL